MKKILFFLLILGAAQAKAQVIKGSIDLKDSTINRSVPFEVADGTKSLKYYVKVYVSRGVVKAYLTDPNGKHSGGFTAGTQTQSGHTEPSKIESTDSVTPPVTGTWKWNIIAEKATGRITYQIDVIKP